MRAALTALLLLSATAAWADAVKVVETSETVYYVDPATLGEKDDARRVSVIQDYAKPDPGGIRSRRVSYEIDCAGERLRSVAGSEYSEPMAQGPSVGSWQRESEWLYVAARTGSNIASRSPYRPIVRFVCSR